MDSNDKEMKARTPEGWDRLTQGELRYALELMSDGVEGPELWTLCMMRWSGMRVEGRDPDGWRLRQGARRQTATREQVAEAAARLAWMDEMEDYDARLDTAAGGRLAAVDRWLHGVAFGDWLKLEIAYQGVMQSHKERPLRRLASLLYRDAQGRTGDGQAMTRAELLGSVLWYSAIKRRLAREFPRLFRKPESDSPYSGMAVDMKEITDAQIRALTGGDVTKEPQVLATDTWRCLAELEARAASPQPSPKGRERSGL